MKNNRCVKCNAIIPEGRQVCPNCEENTMKEYKRITRRTKLGNPYIDYSEIDLDALGVIRHFADIEDKIENGTLIELPCRLGQTVYRIRRKPYKAVLERFVVNITYCYDYKGQPMWRIFTTTEDILGKTVFLTKTEAEAKLKELQNET